VSCFLDEFVPRIDGVGEKVTSRKGQFIDFMNLSVGLIIADHHIHLAPPLL
jgi:hypothetical protein